MSIVIGTAGWTIPRAEAPSFPADGTSLERYAQRFAGVEINSSFHRPHRPSTWKKWAESVPSSFRFAVKVPKTITHEHKLVGTDALISAFIDEIAGLEEKLAVLLVQLPPKLAFDPDVVETFFASVSRCTKVQLACEPRHASWFETDADALLARLGVARVAADPAVVPAAGTPGGWRGFSYWRLHGSPVIYRSSYAGQTPEYARLLAEDAGRTPSVWCMYDNTASSAATGDALALKVELGERCA